MSEPYEHDGSLTRSGDRRAAHGARRDKSPDADGCAALVTPTRNACSVVGGSARAAVRGNKAAETSVNAVPAAWPFDDCGRRISAAIKVALSHPRDVVAGRGRSISPTGRVAILIDGATFSSGEHFILATRAATTAIVIGTKTAGAYGTTTLDTPRKLPGTPALEVTVNQSQVRTIDGKVLDGTSQEPDIVVEYEPAAIAAHQDPMLLRAIAELSK